MTDMSVGTLLSHSSCAFYDLRVQPADVRCMTDMFSLAESLLSPAVAGQVPRGIPPKGGTQALLAWWASSARGLRPAPRGARLAGLLTRKPEPSRDTCTAPTLCLCFLSARARAACASKFAHALHGHNVVTDYIPHDGHPFFFFLNAVSSDPILVLLTWRWPSACTATNVMIIAYTVGPYLRLSPATSPEKFIQIYSHGVGLRPALLRT